MARARHSTARPPRQERQAEAAPPIAAEHRTLVVVSHPTVTVDGEPAEAWAWINKDVRREEP